MPCHRVLIVDDDPDIRTILRRLFLSEGFCVCEASDGVEALAAAAACDVQAILLDITMPRMSGTETLQHVRADPHLAGTPILIITGNAALRPVAHPTPIGTMQILTKPLNLTQVLATVTHMIQRLA